MSNNLGGVDWPAGASNPELPVNERLGRLDAAITEEITVDLSTADKTVTADQLQQTSFIRLTGGATARTVTLTTTKLNVSIKNQTTTTQNIKVGTTTLTLAANNVGRYRLDGTANGLESIAPASGASLPTGGTDGQFLAKNGSADGVAEWRSTPTQTLTVDVTNGDVSVTAVQIRAALVLHINGGTTTRNITLAPALTFTIVSNGTTVDQNIVVGSASVVIKALQRRIVTLDGTTNGIAGGPALIPAGGSTGQALRKKTATIGDLEWSGYTAPAGGTSGQVLAKASGTDGDFTWTTPATGGGSSGPPYYNGSTPYRYWRFLCTASNVNNRYFVAHELEMRSDINGANLAIGKTASSRSNWSGRPASNANDGSLTTFYETGGDQDNQASTSNTVGNYIAYDFGTPVAINFVTLRIGTDFPNERATTGVIQYSTDGTTWVNAWNWTGINTADNSTSTTQNPTHLLFYSTSIADSGAFGRTLLAQTTLALARDVLGVKSQVSIITATNSAFPIPDWAREITIHCIGGGPGGGSGRVGAPGTNRVGGGGGGAGGYGTATFDRSELPGTTLNVTVGTGGTGGAAVTTADTNGNPGTLGTTSRVNDSAGKQLIAGGGGGNGNGGGNSGGGAGGTAGNTVTLEPLGGGQGGTAPGGGTTGSGGNGLIAGAGAGPGGGITSGNVASNGGSCGFGNILGTAVNTAAGGTAPGGAGTAGVAKPWARGFGGAGGGGAAGSADAATPGGKGGNGNIPGGPGGGGGAAANGSQSGAGGDGARGEVWIIFKG